MTKDTSAMLRFAGPPVVARRAELTKMELGGWEIQTRAGAVDDAVDTRIRSLRQGAAFPLLHAVQRL